MFVVHKNDALRTTRVIRQPINRRIGYLYQRFLATTIATHTTQSLATNSGRRVQYFDIHAPEAVITKSEQIKSLIDNRLLYRGRGGYTHFNGNFPRFQKCVVKSYTATSRLLTIGMTNSTKMLCGTFCDVSLSPLPHKESAILDTIDNTATPMQQSIYFEALFFAREIFFDLETFLIPR